MATVAAALIVRDEAVFLPACLLSLAGQVDEVIVVDTGSSDASREIARDHGARVLDFPWCNDFSAARNWGLDAARADWILYIDADERLTVPPGRHLCDGLYRSGAVVAALLFRPRPRWTPYRELRLFRNDARIRFRGAIHETIRPALESLPEFHDPGILDSPATLVHFGYEGDQTRKHLRNLPLLQEAVRREPLRFYFSAHLAEVLNGLGRREEALAVCRHGWAIARETPPQPGSARHLLAFTYARLQREAGEDAIATIEAGLAQHPEHRALQFLKARVLIDRGECTAALAILDALASLHGTCVVDPVIAYDEQIFGAHAFELQAIALLRLGRRRAAAEAFGRAAAADPSEPSYRIRQAALGGCVGEGRPAQALDAATDIGSHRPDFRAMPSQRATRR